MPSESSPAINPANLLSAASSDGGKTLNFPFVSDDQKSLLLLCYGRPLSSTEWRDIALAQAKEIAWSSTGLLRNTIKSSPDNPVRIFPDGTYSGTLQLFPWFLSKSLSGLTMMLPTDYIPGNFLETYAAEPSFEEKMLRHFNEQLRIFPQEKICLHTDKPYYISGEQIWFRAHMVDASTHISTTLNNHIPASLYVYVELINPHDEVVCRVKIRENDGTYYGSLLIPDTIPEGGSLMQGALCKVAFKAMKSDGQAIDINDAIYDQNRNEIKKIQTEHLGMGGFSLLTEKGKSY